MKTALTFLIVVGLAATAHAKIKTQLVEYKQGTTVLEGYLAYDDAVKGKRPGVLVVHAWMGLDDNARKRADMLAGLGYVAFAADICGTTAIELARNGAAIAGVVTFHGGLDSPAPADGKNIKAKLLVLHGAADPHESASDLAAFQKELTDAKVDWQLIEYGGAVHCFTDQSAGTDPAKGCAYDASADARSWAAMRAFFDEIFAKKKA